MKINIFITVLIISFIAVLRPASSIIYAQGNDVVNIHQFYSKTCPHCAKEERFLDKMEQKYPALIVNRYEITENKNAIKVLVQLGQQLEVDVGGVPFLVIGNKAIIGYQDDQTTGVEIEEAILKEILSPSPDIVSQLFNENVTENNPGENSLANDNNGDTSYVTAPLFGKINLEKLSLPMLTIVLGLLDGFNPCAMWVLLFLISMLIGVKDRKRMWVLGGSFLITSAIIYFLFMAAWLNVFLVIGYATIVRYVIAVGAIGIGIYYLKRYMKNKDGGCETANAEKKKRIFDRIKTITTTHNLFLATLGVISLAIAVNAIELLCSAGLPAIYTRVLSMTPMGKVAYYLYLVLYVLMFLLDDLIIFAVAMFTLQTVGIESKYSRYSQLVGGIIMLLLGIIMAFKPELLTFGN